MNKKLLLVLKVILLFIYLPSVLAGNPVSIRKFEGIINFDGLPVDSVWHQMEQFPLSMHRPDFGFSPSELSDVRVGYDDQYIWVGASLYMRDVKQILSMTKKRDAMLFSNDAFGIILDTYRDNENGLAFFTAPTGIRTDYAISNDAVMTGDGFGLSTILNISWNTFWDVKTFQDDKGWYLEMRIPFSSLKFKPAGNNTTMGIILIRNIGANHETDTYPAIEPKYGFMSPYKPSVAGEIDVKGIEPSRPIYISPYILGGYSRTNILNDAGTKYDHQQGPEKNIGLDVKYNLGSNLTLDLTANTDFAQVEADAQQVNLTRYAMFFPEKRKFFQERSSLFDFNLGGQYDNLFYSRNIGIVDGTIIKTYGGARLTGRIGKWDMGLLDMQTASCSAKSGENFGVLRMRRQVINPNSYVGGILTSRTASGNYQNMTYGLDGIFKLYGDDYLTVKWAQTYDRQTDARLNSLNSGFILTSWERRTEKGWGYNFNYLYSGSLFNPASGYVMRSGFNGGSAKMLYGWLPGTESALFNYNVSIKAERYERLSDHHLESMMLTPAFEMSTKKGVFGSLAALIQQEGVSEDFNLSDSVIIRAGDYHFNSVMINLGTPNTNKIALMMMFNAGQFYDGYRMGPSTNLIFNLSSSVNLNMMYEYYAIRFPGRTLHKKLDIHSVNVNALFMINTKLSANFIVQYVNTYKDLITNFRLRYNPKEGNDLYLVINDYRQPHSVWTIPEVPSYYEQTVMVKYIHTFKL